MAVIDIWPHPITTEGRKNYELKSKCVIEELVAENFDPVDIVTVWFDHEVIPRRDWVKRDVCPGDESPKVVTVRKQPAGGTEGSNPTAVVLSLAIVAAAAATGGYLAPILGPAAAQSITAVIATGGIIAVNAIFPPHIRDDDQARAEQFGFSQGANALRQYDPLILTLGKHRVFPDYASAEYLEYDHEGNQYINRIYDFGLGDLRIRNIRIGETLLSDYKGVEQELQVNPITIVSGNVDTIAGGELEYQQAVVRVTAPDTTRLAFDFISTNYQREDNGNIRGGVNDVRITWARKVGDATTGRIETAFGIPSPSDEDAYNPVRFTFTPTLPLTPGSYEVQITLLTDLEGKEEDNDKFVGKCILASVKASQDETADFADRNPLAIRVQASGQIHGGIDRMNADAESLIPAWNGALWVSGQATSNPAWIYRKYLQGWRGADGNLLAGVGLPDSRINDTEIQAWGAFCDDQGLECNMVIAEQRDHFTNLKNITRCGWASPSRDSGMWGVVYEIERVLPTAIFTPANIIAGSISVVYENEGLADEIVGTFFDRDSSYEQNTLRRTIPGTTNPERPAYLRLEGITDGEQAAKEINRTAAAQFHHNRVISFETSLEGKSVARGDAVALTSDLVGGGEGGRLLQVGNDKRTLTLSGQVSANGTMWIWMPSGVVHSSTFVRQDSSQVLLDDSIPGQGTGVSDSPEAYRYMIYSSTLTTLFRVTSKSPAAGGRFKFTLRDDPEEYYAARTSDLSHQLIRRTFLPAVTGIIVNESVKDISGGFVTVLHVFVVGNLLFRSAVLSVEGEVAGVVLSGELHTIISPVQSGPVTITATPGNEFNSSGTPLTVVYEVRGKAWRPSDVPGFTVSQQADGTRVYSWDLVLEHEVRQNGGYEIRYAPQADGATWETMTALLTGVITTTKIELNAPGEGTWDFAICAVDSLGNYSANPAYFEIALGPPRLGDSLYDSCEGLEGWPGVVLEGIREDQRLVSTDPLSWDELTTWDAYTAWSSEAPGRLVYESRIIDLRAEHDFIIVSYQSVTGTLMIQYRHGDPLSQWQLYQGEMVNARFIQVRWTVTNLREAAVMEGLCFSLYGGVGMLTPGPPVGLEAFAEDEIVILSWQPPASSGGAAITHYQYRIGEDGSPTNVAMGNQTVTITGLVNGQPYDFFVRAINTHGEGPWAGPATATPTDTLLFQVLSVVLRHQTGEQISHVLPEASGGVGDKTYSVSGLPLGLAFAPSSRRLTGAIALTGRYPFNYTATDTIGGAATIPVTVIITDESDLTPEFPSATRTYEYDTNESISQVLLAATGGNGTLGYTVSSLPSQLTYDPTSRRITGTFTTAGRRSFTYTVTDADGDQDSMTIFVDISTPPPPPPPLPPDLRPEFPSETRTYEYDTDESISQVLPAASGGDSPLTYSVSGLPSGLSFDPQTRRITGTFATAGSRSFTYTVTDADGDHDTMAISVDISTPPPPPPPDLMPEFPSASRTYEYDTDESISQELPAASGGDSPLTYSVSGLPSELTFAPSTRRITGTFTFAGGRAFTYRVTDADGDDDTMAISVDISTPPPPDLMPEFPSDSRTYEYDTNESISQVLPLASGGDSPLTYSVSGLPFGLSFDPQTRRMTGTFTTSGSRSFPYTVTDADGDDDTMTISVDVSSPDLMPVFPSDSRTYEYDTNESISQVLPLASGGDSPLTYSVSGLPFALSFAPSTRRITGTFTTAGSRSFTYRVTDDDGDDDTMTIVISITTPPPPDLMPEFPSASRTYEYDTDESISRQLPAASGGDSPLTYSVSGLPSELTFAPSTRRITGTFATAGSRSFTYTVTDEDGDHDTMAISVDISTPPPPPPPDLMPEFPSASRTYEYDTDESISQELPAASGGDSPLTYSVSGLPSELTFAPSTRRITGTFTFAGGRAFTYRVTDDDGDHDTMAISIDISTPPPPDLMPEFPSDSRTYEYDTNESISQVLPLASGGDSPLTYSVAGLPFGLSFDPQTRRMTGTVTTSGSRSFPYTVTDEDGDQDSMTIYVDVSSPDLMPVFPSDSRTYEYDTNESISQVLPAASGGDSPLTYSVAGLPSALSFAPSTRRITGTFTTAGSRSFTYRVTDEDGDDDTMTIVISITTPPPPDLMPEFPSASRTYEYDTDESISRELPAASGGDSPLTYSVSGLPSALSFDPSTRIMTGTFATAGSRSFTYTVTDEDGDDDTMTIVISITTPPPPDLMPEFPSASRTYEYDTDESISRELPAATGGDSPLTYSVSGLPSELTFEPQTRRMTGTFATAGSRSFTYTVTDEDGDDDTMTIVISITTPAVDSAPFFPGDRITYNVETGDGIDITLPAATGGDPPLFYSVSGLPSGLSFAPSTRRLTGSGFSTIGTRSFTYRVDDNDDDYDTMTIYIAVTAPDRYPSFSGETRDYSYETDESISLTLPAASGGDPPLVYQVANLPSQLMFDPTTRRITGSFDTVGTHPFNYIVQDADGDPDDLGIQITITDPPPDDDLTPEFSGETRDYSYETDESISLTLPAASSGDAPLVYQVANLPSQLMFDPSLRRITGSFDMAGTYPFNYIVQDADGDSDDLGIQITITDPPPPEDLMPEFSGGSRDYSYETDESISLTLPAAMGGDQPVTYSVGQLPAALSFNASTRRITGSFGSSGSHTFSLRATDVDGDFDELAINITITDPPPPEDLTPTAPAFPTLIYSAGELIDYQFPPGGGGDPPLTYSLSGYPSDLSFDSSTRTLSGRVSSTGTWVLRYTVTDDDGDFDYYEERLVIT